MTRRDLWERLGEFIMWSSLCMLDSIYRRTEDRGKQKVKRPVTDPILFNYAVKSPKKCTLCKQLERFGCTNLSHLKYVMSDNLYNVTNVIMTTQQSNAPFRRLGQTCNRISSWGLKHDIHNWIRNGSSPARPAGRQRHQNLKWTLQKQYCVLAW